MARITKIKGEFMGVEFEVKPAPIRLDLVVKERQEMLRNWYKENDPDFHAKITDESLTIDDYTIEDLTKLNAWKHDVKFRAQYCKFTADKSIKLRSELTDEIWESDDLELGTLEEAWDFFTERRQVPLSGV